MGCWSTEINGGDTPMDIECCLADFMRLDTESDDYEGIPESGKLTADVVRSFLETETKLVDSLALCEEISILYAVLGALLMEAGADIPEDFRAEIIEQARLDRWAKESEERKVVIEQFVRTLEEYDNETPTELPRGDFFDINTQPDYIGTESHGNTPPRQRLHNLMPRICALSVNNLKTERPPTMFYVVGYAEGRLLARSKHDKMLLTEADLRRLHEDPQYELQLFEFNELTITD